jgi:acetyl esterase/lipase
MRVLRAGVIVLGLPLLWAAAPAGTAPEATLRLTPRVDAAQDMPLPPAAAANPAPPQPLSFGLQKISYPSGVTATFAQTYGSLRGFRPLTLDLYQPPARGSGLPLLVFVHGGGWNGGDTRHAASFADFPRELATLAARGYVVASVGYRLSGEARFPAAVQDIKAAIRWLRAHAADLGIDPTRVAVWGDGAGGQLAALVGVTCGVTPFEPDARDNGEMPSDCVQAVIDMGGASDLQGLEAAAPDTDGKAEAGFQPPPSSDAGDFLGCEPARCPPMVAKLASPMTYISATSPPFLILHGGADAEIPAGQSQKLYDALRRANVPAELMIYPGTGHNFTRAGQPDIAALSGARDRLAAFLAATFPPVPLGPKIAQPRGSLY